jgi:DNA-binding CsgD family transcriptional regulator
LECENSDSSGDVEAAVYRSTIVGMIGEGPAAGISLPERTATVVSNESDHAMNTDPASNLSFGHRAPARTIHRSPWMASPSPLHRDRGAGDMGTTPVRRRRGRHHTAAADTPVQDPVHIMITSRELTDFCRHEVQGLWAFLLAQGARPDEAQEAIQEPSRSCGGARTAFNTSAPTPAPLHCGGFHRTRAARIEEPIDWIDAEFSILDLPTMEAHEEVTTLLSALPGLQRRVMALTFDGYTPAEIADLLESNPNTVRVSLHRARSKLKAQLRRDHHVVTAAPIQPSHNPSLSKENRSLPARRRAEAEHID